MVHKKTSGEESSHSLTSRLEVGLTLMAPECKLRKQFFLFENQIFTVSHCLPPYPLSNLWLEWTGK